MTTTTASLPESNKWKLNLIGSSASADWLTGATFTVNDSDPSGSFSLDLSDSSRAGPRDAGAQPPEPLKNHPMKEHPILFNGPMVQAILDGRKTQTRRIIKPQPRECGFGTHAIIKPYCTGTDWPLAYYERRGACWNSSKPLKSPCREGDRLWVRETWYCDHGLFPDAPIEEMVEMLEYRATHKCANWEAGCPCKDESGRGSWRPSILMPRWASRITLEVTDVRVERLQDISEDDAKAEGVEPFLNDPEGDCWTDGKHRTAFNYLWNEINGWDPNAWDQNPWVWAITFRTLKTT